MRLRYDNETYRTLSSLKHRFKFIYGKGIVLTLTLGVDSLIVNARGVDYIYPIISRDNDTIIISTYPLN